MKEEFVSYEQAKQLKELGFLWSCDHYYCAFDNETDVRFWSVHPAQSQNAFRSPKDKGVADAPSLSMAQKWLREVKDTIVIAEPYWECEIEDDSDYLTGKWCFVVWIEGCRILCNFDPSKEDEELWLFDTYESALSAGIANALNLLSEKK